MNLLITGGAGFIGSRFAEMLLLDEIIHEFTTVTIVDSLTYSGNLDNIASLQNKGNFFFYKEDICDEQAIQKIFTKRNINYVVNFAAESHVDRSIKSSFEFLRTNIMGTHTLLEASKANNIQRYIQISTDEVYGSISSGSWTEEFPLDPNSPYSASKASADLVVMAYSRTHNLNTGITRCCNNYGPRQFPEKIIPLFATNLIEGIKLPIYGDGNQIREWIHVDDHCRAIFKVLMDGRPMQIYNITGFEEVTNLELTRKILNYFEKDEKECLIFVEDRKAHDYRYSLNASKIREELKFAPKIPLEEGLRETLNWYVKNDSWWKKLKQR